MAREQVPERFEIEPRKGAGPFRLGDSRADITHVLDRFGSYSEYAPSPTESIRLFADCPALVVGLSLEEEHVQYLVFTHGQDAAELRQACSDCHRQAASTSPACSYIVSLQGIDIFHTHSADLLTALGDDSFDEEEEGTMWVSRHLQVALWREDPSLPFFQSVTVGGPW